MATLITLSNDLATLAGGVTALTGAPLPPFIAADVPKLTLDAAAVQKSQAHVAGLAAGAPTSLLSNINACDHEVDVAQAMIDAVNNGTPGTLTSKLIFSQITVVNVLAMALT